MLVPSRSWCVHATLLAALAGCAADDTGDFCRHDYQCASNSCTLLSCDDPLAAAIIGRGKKSENEEKKEPAKPAPGPPVSPPASCSALCEVLSSEYACTRAAGCHAEWQCASPAGCVASACLTRSCEASDADHCQSPCQRIVRCTGTREC